MTLSAEKTKHQLWRFDMQTCFIALCTCYPWFPWLLLFFTLTPKSGVTQKI
jgi:hypothetical protein